MLVTGGLAQKYFPEETMLVRSPLVIPIVQDFPVLKGGFQKLVGGYLALDRLAPSPEQTRDFSVWFGLFETYQMDLILLHFAFASIRPFYKRKNPKKWLNTVSFGAEAG